MKEISDSQAVSLTYEKVKNVTRRELVLCIGSKKDEAWQLLHHMQNIKNPLATDEGVVTYLLNSISTQFLMSCQKSRIYGARGYLDLVALDKVILCTLHVAIIFFLVVVFGAKDLQDAGFPLVGMAGIYILLLLIRMRRGADIYSAFFSPIRLIWHCLNCFSGLITSMITYFVRRSSWFVLQRIAMGLEGYKFKLPPIERRPSSVAADITRYEDMPEGAEQHALAMRTNWMTRALGDVSDALSSETLTTGDMSSLLRKIADDPSLVHAAYYTDDKCIVRIADWIAGNG